MFYFHSLFGEIIKFDEHIFQMGWFNHQLQGIDPKKSSPTNRLSDVFVASFWGGKVPSGKLTN